MIKGIGIDIIELERIKESIRKNNKIIKRILTPKEQEHFHQLRSKQREVEFLAGRFAAKEAFAKATGQGIGKLSFQHMNILPNTNGAPIMTVDGYEESSIWLSISHSREYAIAQVVIEK